MSQVDLASAAVVGRSTVIDFESGAREPRPPSLAAMQKALEKAGVEFTNGDEPGVKLRRRAKK